MCLKIFQEIKQLIRLKGSVYALDKETCRWAPFSIHQDHLLLHTFRFDCPPPADGVAIPVCNILMRAT